MSDDPPARREPRQDRARARVRSLLEATAELLREDGLDAVTTSRVAARAGSSLPSLYRYFPDRTALLHALAEDLLEELHGAMVELLGGIRTREQARAALQAVFAAYVGAFRADAALRQLWAGTLVDPVLVELNVADSRRNGRLLADRLGPFSTLPDRTLQDRCLLTAQLTQATVAFALGLEREEGDRLLAEFASWADVLLLPD